MSSLRHGSLANELVAKLRSEFGHSKAPLWTVDIEAEKPEHLPAEWYVEQTLRGDFLRAVLNSGDLPAIEATLQSILSPGEIVTDHLDDNFYAWSAVGRNTPESHQRLLQEAAWLGCELLNPEETVS